MESVTYFLSHSWSAKRWQKMVALLYHFNLPIALWCCAVVGYASFLLNLMVGEDLRSWWVPGLVQPEWESIIDGSRVIELLDDESDAETAS